MCENQEAVNIGIKEPVEKTSSVKLRVPIAPFKTNTWDPCTVLAEP